ncbi:MAG: cytochrome C oxidase subunit IV family protein [bacterium]
MSSITASTPASRGHDKNVVLYAEIFGILISLTILTVTLSYMDIGWIFDWKGRAANIFAGILVAVVKSSLVLWFFMHMNHESRLNRSIFAFALCLFLLAVFVYSCDFVWLKTYVVEGARAVVGM